MLSKLSGARMVHVPYKGGGDAIKAVLAQETQLLFLTPLALMPHVRAGKLRALGVTSTWITGTRFSRRAARRARSSSA